MDLIVTYAIRLWMGAILIVCLPILLAWLLRVAVGVARLLPPFRGPLASTAAWLATWTDRLQSAFMVVFLGAAAWPVLIVALPVAGMTWLLFRWLVPDTPPADEGEGAHHHAPAGALEWPLRLVTITAFAQLLATAALLWLVKRPATPVVLGLLDGEAVQIDRLVVLTASAFLPVGFGLLLSGAWVNTLGRALVIAVLLMSSRPPAWTGAPLAAWLTLIATLGVCGVMPLWRPRTSPLTSLGFVVRALTITLGLGGFLAVMAWTIPAAGGHYPSWLDRVVSEQVFMVTPVLFMAGVDFVGLGTALGRRVTRTTLRSGSGVPAAAAALIAALVSGELALAIGGIDASGLRSLLLFLLTGAVVVGIFSLVATGFDWLGRFDMVASVALLLATIGGLLALFVYTEGRLAVTAIAVVMFALTVPLLKPRGDTTWANAGLTMAAVAVMAVMMAGTREVVVLVRAAYEIPPNPRTTAFQPTTFEAPGGNVSAAIPTFWTLTARPDHLRFDAGADPYATGAFLLRVLEPARLEGTGVDAFELPVASMLNGFPFPDLTLTTRYDSQSGIWRQSQATVIRDGRRYLIDVFDRDERGLVWLLVFISGERYERYFSPAVVGVVGSWRFDDTATAPAPVPPPDLRRRVANVGGFGFLPVLFAPVGYWLLYRKQSGPPTGTRRDHAGMLAVFVTATAVLFLPDTALVEFWRGREAPANPLATLQLMLAGGTVLTIGLAMLTRQLRTFVPLLRELAAANVALFVMAAVYAIYGAAIPLGDRRVEIEVAIFLVALIWDLFTSGREITGADSPAFPRAARVLSYLGYLVVVSTIALFISTQTLASSGESLPKLVESEDVVRQGLVWLGAPLLLLRTALRWVESVRRGQLPD